MSKLKKIGESGEIAYEKDGKIYSAFQRDEIVTMWQDKEGKVAYTVRPRTAIETLTLMKKIRKALKKVLWIKH